MRYENILSKIHLHKIFYTTRNAASFLWKEIRGAVRIGLCEAKASPDRAIPPPLNPLNPLNLLNPGRPAAP